MKRPPLAIGAAVEIIAEHFVGDDPGCRAIGRALGKIVNHLPDLYWEDKPQRPYSGPTIPLYEALDDVGQAITDACIAIIFDEEVVAKDSLPDLRKQLLENEASANGLTMRERRRSHVLAPNEMDEDPETLCRWFLKDTPLLDFFLYTPVPFKIPRDRWPTHAIILAPSEWGKSEITGLFLREALEDPEPRAIILCDPHGDLYKKALRRISPERLVAIDLTRNPPDLNILDTGVMPERDAIQAFRFLVSSLAGGLTPKQEACIRPLFSLLRLIPDATLVTLHEIITDEALKAHKSVFAPYIQQLEPVHKAFFERLWYSGKSSDTREALQWKVQATIDDPTFRRMFSAKRNALNIPRWIEEKKVVLIKSSDQLDKEGTRLFFLYIIGQYYAAAKRRDAISENKRHLAQLFFDEASVVLQAPIIADILVEIRKYNCAFIAATQLWHHVAENVRPAVLGSTGIRILGQLGHDEASALYRDMKVPSVETIMGLHAVPRQYAQWCFFVRSVTEKGMVVKVPYGALKAMPKQNQFPDAGKMVGTHDDDLAAAITDAIWADPEARAYVEELLAEEEAETQKQKPPITAASNLSPSTSTLPQTDDPALILAYKIMDYPELRKLADKILEEKDAETHKGPDKSEPLRSVQVPGNKSARGDTTTISDAARDYDQEAFEACYDEAMKQLKAEASGATIKPGRDWSEPT